MGRNGVFRKLYPESHFVRKKSGQFMRRTMSEKLPISPKISEACHGVLNFQFQTSQTGVEKVLLQERQ
jgi:hypothetical protein